MIYVNTHNTHICIGMFIHIYSYYPSHDSFNIRARFVHRIGIPCGKGIVILNNKNVGQDRFFLFICLIKVLDGIFFFFLSFWTLQEIF